MADKNNVNREYKSSLFSYIFSQKEYALQLYNALNNSHYDNPEEVRITTLENVVFINIYNDVSFMFNSTLQFYEHQSTFNPNMPLRNLFYLANTYEKYIKELDEDLYSSSLIKIPTPTCIVFYNGAKNEPDQLPLKLSDAFINREAEASLELVVKMININYDYNRDLMSKCEALYGYSLYISKVREYNNIDGMDIQEASIKALDYCIEEDIFADFFRERRNEVVGMILEEYTLEHIEQRTARKVERLTKELKDAHRTISDKDSVIQTKDAEIQSKDAEITRLKQLLENNTK